MDGYLVTKPDLIKVDEVRMENGDIVLGGGGDGPQLLDEELLFDRIVDPGTLDQESGSHNLRVSAIGHLDVCAVMRVPRTQIDLEHKQELVRERVSNSYLNS